MKKTTQTAINISMSAILVATSTGCSAFRSSVETMNVKCNPADSILMVNGERYTPPAQVTVKRDREVSIQCYKEGFVPYERTIGYHFNTTGALDAVGTALFLVPCIGLFTPGAWSLDETNVTVSLVPK
jgi:hypothetical protein